jgi:hypothetical protein
MAETQQEKVEAKMAGRAVNHFERLSVELRTCIIKLACDEEVRGYTWPRLRAVDRQMKADCALIMHWCVQNGNEYQFLRALRRPAERGLECLALRFEHSWDQMVCLQGALWKAQSTLEDFRLEVAPDEGFLDADRQELLFNLLGDCPKLHSLYLEFTAGRAYVMNGAHYKLNIQAGSVVGPGFQGLRTLNIHSCMIESFPFDALPRLGGLKLEAVSISMQPLCIRASHVRVLHVSNLCCDSELEVPGLERLVVSSCAYSVCLVGGLSHLSFLSIVDVQNISLGPSVPEVLQEVRIERTFLGSMAQVLSGFKRVCLLSVLAVSQISVADLSTALNNIVQLYVREAHLLLRSEEAIIELEPDPAFESLKVLQLDFRAKQSPNVGVARGFLLRAQNLRQVTALVDRSKLMSVFGWDKLRFFKVPVTIKDPICGW